MSTVVPTMMFTDHPTLQARKKKTAAWLKYGGGGLACIILIAILYFVLSKKKTASMTSAPPLDRAQLLAAHATQLHKDLTGFS